MKKLSFLALLPISILLLSACNKKGCTDINGYNYNEKSVKDDGSCKYYQAVIVKSATVNDVPSTNNGDNWDLDDNSAADIYVAIQKADGSYLEAGSLFYENAAVSEANPIIFDVNKLVTQFDETLTLLVLDYDASATTDQVVFSRTFNFNDYTYNGANNLKFPTSLTLNNQASEVVLELEWSED